MYRKTLEATRQTSKRKEVIENAILISQTLETYVQNS